MEFMINRGISILRSRMSRRNVCSSIFMTVLKTGLPMNGKMHIEIMFISSCGGSTGRMLPAFTSAAICEMNFEGLGG